MVMFKQSLELKQQQKLSPLQIQTIKLIELPVQELEQRIRKELDRKLKELDCLNLKRRQFMLLLEF